MYFVLQWFMLQQYILRDFKSKQSWKNILLIIYSPMGGFCVGSVHWSVQTPEFFLADLDYGPWYVRREMYVYGLFIKIH